MTKRLNTYLALFLFLGALGCKQGRGDRCQLNDDCSDGLCCSIPQSSGTMISGGSCEPGMVSAATGRCIVSSSAPQDAAPLIESDLTSTDAPESDLTSTDAPIDSATTD